MGLAQYRKMRDFRTTSEPRGGERAGARKKAAKGLSFVVQKHDASHLHYDFRLELDGVLKSWAVPKGPSLNPKDRRLAVQVEDHPIEYGDFEGTIPAGEYGGGTVMVWDRGTWEPLGDARQGLEKGKLRFVLHGEKLRGSFTLARMGRWGGRGGDSGKPQWLLMKRDDEEVDAETDVLDRARSVKSGRTMQEIREDKKGKVWRSNRREAWSSGSSNGRSAKERRPIEIELIAPGEKGLRERASGNGHAGENGRARRTRPAGAVKAPMPAFLTPQLCEPVEEVPSGEEWIHEIKFDGYRLLARKDGKSVKLLTRRGQDWTAKFDVVAEAVAALPVKTALIDGEATMLETTGRTAFQRLQSGIKAKDFADLRFFVFDLLYCNGYDLTKLPLHERKEALQAIVETSGPKAEIVQFSAHVEGQGGKVRSDACELGLEGIISKDRNAPYVPGRTGTWVKVKCGLRQEFVVVGWTPPSGARQHFGSLLLGAHDETGKFVYVGRVGTGFDSDLLDELAAKLKKLATRLSPVEGMTRAEAADAHWVKPKLVAEVSFGEWTRDRRLRQPAFLGLREDKGWDAVRIETMTAKGGPRARRERPIEPLPPTPRRRAKGGAKKDEHRPEVAGVGISHPEREVFPDVDFTKLELAQYYERVAELVLPHVEGRAMSVVRCPGGAGGAIAASEPKMCFFQKHLGDTFPSGGAIGAVHIEEKEAKGEYITIDSLKGLITLVQFGVIELHPWGSTIRKLEQPDRLIFDLDPAEGVTFEQVKIGALQVREMLREVDLESFLKTSGGKGLHVVVPLRGAGGVGWDETKEFCKTIANRMAAREPDRYLATASKAARKGRIFVDYLRNGRGATAVAAYSVRARAAAPVSMPLEWKALAELDRANGHTAPEADEWLTRAMASGKDVWVKTGFFTVRQSLTATRANEMMRLARGK